MNRRIVFLLLPLAVLGITIWFGTGQVETGPDQLTKETGETLTVAGLSMSPTLQPGEQVRLDESPETELQRGELVAINFSTRERKMLKRIIALPGDSVEFIDGRLNLNGDWLATDWWPEDKRLAIRGYKVLSIQLGRYDNTVPKNSLVVMGDNSDVSYDSGDYGMISMSQVAGRVERVAK